jgi:glycosyltransferase involved in cell wall biosynthesis
MRILLTIKNFDFGGAENHVCELANALDKRGHTVFVMGKKGRQSYRLNPTVVFLSFPLRSTLILFNLIQMLKILKKHRIQLIHAHQRYAIHLSSVAGLLAGIPVVLTVHGRSQFDLRSVVARRVSKKIIFVSAYVMKHAIRFPSIQHKIVLITNGIQTPARTPHRKTDQICYVSRIDRRHSAVLLLMVREVLPSLLEHYPDATLHVIGEGAVLPIIMQEAKQLNASLQREVCRFEGFHPEVSDLLLDSALVMGVGRVALEALACGTPVLSVNKKRMGALLNTQNYHFYKTNNFVAVGHPAPDAGKLLRQLNDYFSRPTYWLEESSKLQNLVSEDFSCEKTMESILEVYREAVKSS